MSEELTKGDLLEVIGRIDRMRDHIDKRLDANRQEYGQWFHEINAKLAQLNGKVAEHEKAIAIETHKLRALESVVYERRSSARVPPPQEYHEVVEDEKPALSRGEMKRVAAGVGIVWVGIQMAGYVGRMVMGAVKALLANGGGR